MPCCFTESAAVDLDTADNDNESVDGFIEGAETRFLKQNDHSDMINKNKQVSILVVPQNSLNTK